MASVSPDLVGWIDDRRSGHGKDFRIHWDHLFIWLTDLGEDAFARCQQLAHYGHDRCRNQLADVCWSAPHGLWPVFLFRHQDDLCAHLNHISAGSDAQNESIIPGGAWCSGPFGHFAMPYSPHDTLDAAMAHEFVHAVLNDLPTPIWLEEGLACNVETSMGHRAHPFSDMHAIREFRLHWTTHDPSVITEHVAYRNPRSSQHAYSLAQGMVTQLQHDNEQFVRFILSSSYEDGGESALQRIYGSGLSDLINSVITPPRPQGWFARLLNQWFGID